MATAKKPPKRRAVDAYENNIKPHLLEIAAWARDGVIDKDIAENLNVNYSTFKRHKLSGKHPEFTKLLKVSKNVADITVENALYKKALGFSYTEQTKELMYDKKTDTMKLTTTKTVSKTQPPDVAACVVWLCNRKGDTWRNKQKDTEDSAQALEKLDSVLAKVNEDMAKAPTAGAVTDAATAAVSEQAPPAEVKP